MPSDAISALPEPRGPASARLLDALAGRPGRPFDGPVPAAGDPLGDDDLHLSLFLCYELHYRGLAGVDDRWEWDPALLGFRARLEAAFERGLRDAVILPGGDAPIEDRLLDIVRSDAGPSLSAHLQQRGTLEEFRELVVHRSAYQLKEADPHTWAIPRLAGPPKAALIAIQSEEYGGGSEERMHSSLFARAMSALGLDPAYGAYLDVIPGTTLATVNLMSMFGLHRRLRGALVGHLAAFEMTSTEPNARYADALRRLGVDGDAAAFYLEHVEADASHEILAARDLAGGLVRREPGLAGDVLFGAAALLELERRFAERLLRAWAQGRTSLRARLPLPVPA